MNDAEKVAMLEYDFAYQQNTIRDMIGVLVDQHNKLMAENRALQFEIDQAAKESTTWFNFFMSK